MLTKFVGSQGWLYEIKAKNLYVQSRQSSSVREVAIGGNTMR
jgi:hypothetical protein